MNKRKIEFVYQGARFTTYTDKPAAAAIAARLCRREKHPMGLSVSVVNETTFRVVGYDSAGHIYFDENARIV